MTTTKTKAKAKKNAKSTSVKVVDKSKKQKAIRTILIERDSDNVLFINTYNSKRVTMKYQDVLKNFLIDVDTRKASKQNYNVLILAKLYANKKQSQVKKSDEHYHLYDVNTKFDTYRTRLLNFLTASLTEAQKKKYNKRLACFYSTDKSSVDKIVKV